MHGAPARLAMLHQVRAPVEFPLEGVPLLEVLIPGFIPFGKLPAGRLALRLGGGTPAEDQRRGGGRQGSAQTQGRTTRVLRILMVLDSIRCDRTRSYDVSRRRVTADSVALVVFAASIPVVLPLIRNTRLTCASRTCVTGSHSLRTFARELSTKTARIAASPGTASKPGTVDHQRPIINRTASFREHLSQEERDARFGRSLTQS